MILSRDDVYSVVAEAEGRIVGSNFLWESDSIAGVGPITIRPSAQNGSIGRRLMEGVLERARTKRFAGVRLVQSAYHNRSLSLYTKLGFDAREPLSVMQGPTLTFQFRAIRCGRLASGISMPAISLCFQVHGHDRRREVREATKKGKRPRGWNMAGRITGYATLIGFFGHAVGHTNEELKALIGAAREFQVPDFCFQRAMPTCSVGVLTMACAWSIR